MLFIFKKALQNTNILYTLHNFKKTKKANKMTIKFNKHNVTNGTIKARVMYSTSARIDGREAVTIYAKDYDRNLGKIFADEYKNDTDTQTDYFDQGRVVLFADHPLYAKALERAATK